MLIIHHATVYTPEMRLDDAALYIDDGTIQKIGSTGTLTLPLDAPYIDAHGSVLAPGFIDLQLNGGWGDDFTAQPESIWRVAEQLPRYGVTAFLPTIITAPLERATAAREVLQKRPPGFRGAEPLGLHLEGPFVNPQKKGAHNPAYMRLPDIELTPHWARQDGVYMVTLAPELPGALDMVRELTARGVVVSMGHTMSTLEEANAGYNAGIRYATHLFNAMPPLDHRAPGAVGAVLANSQWLAGLIPDGVHVHPALIKSTWTAKESHGVNLVSDAMGALGMPPGVYQLNDFDVYVTEREARLKDGTLAGSVLPLNHAVRNFFQYTDCTFPEALQTVTTTPARLLNLQHQRGRVAEGMSADLVLLDVQFDVKMTIVRGEVAFRV